LSEKVLVSPIHFHIRSEGQIIKLAAYTAIGASIDGKTDQPSCGSDPPNKYSDLFHALMRLHKIGATPEIILLAVTL